MTDYKKNGHPIEKIKLFENKKICSEWDEIKQEWLFSILDVVQALTGSADVKQYIKRMISRDASLKSNWGTICTAVDMTALIILRLARLIFPNIK